MPYPTEPLKEHPSAYFVQDRENKEEIARLETQDKMLNIGMGELFPDGTEPRRLRRVLDVGCGTGGWLMNVAKQYPRIENGFGVDISNKMTEYARAQAQAQHLGDRVQFRTMDALRILNFPPGYFDLVNQRLGVSWLRRWEWNKILLEYERVARTDGIIRITECDIIIESNSPALTVLCEIALQAAHNSGRLFDPCSDGVTRHLHRLLIQHGFEGVQTQIHRLTFVPGTEMGQYFSEDIRTAFRVALPFFQKWTNVRSDYEEIYQRALRDLQQPSFEATWQLLTAYGTRPEYVGHLLMSRLR